MSSPNQTENKLKKKFTKNKIAFSPNGGFDYIKSTYTVDLSQIKKNLFSYCFFKRLYSLSEVFLSTKKKQQTPIVCTTLPLIQVNTTFHCYF